MPCRIWISAFCSFLLSLCLLTSSTRAFQPWESKSWLALYTPSQHLRLTDGQEGIQDILGDNNSNNNPADALGDTFGDILNAQETYFPWDDEDETMESDSQSKQLSLASASERHKRVFLSRGWAAGGYKAPVSSPNRFVRRPPGIVETPVQFTKPTPAGGSGEAQYAALVSDQPQQNPSYRRFHSIFTSGMWTPLGKRSRGGGQVYPAQEYY